MRSIARRAACIFVASTLFCGTECPCHENGAAAEEPRPPRSLRSQHGARRRLRAERGPSPQELVKQASLAARLQDLDIIRLEAGVERREQCSNLTGITSPDNQTRSWLTSQNNQKVVLTGIQYHFGSGAETGPDRPSRALEPSDRHLHTPKQPFHFKYHLFSCRIRPSPAVSGRFRPYS